MSNEERILKAIKNTIKPHGNVDLIEWVKKNCNITGSQKGSTIDLALTPYFIEPFNEILTNPVLKEINICAPVGSGKSTALVALATTVVGLYPKEMMFVGQNEQQTHDFLELKVKPTLKKNKDIFKIWPMKNMNRKESIHFPHMSIYTGYATAMNTLQSRSIDLLCMDEVWMYEKEGVIEEARRRLHDRVGSRMVCVSQGGIVGDQFHQSYSRGLIKQYAWICECGAKNIYNFDDLKFDYQKEEDGTPKWNSVYAHLECPCCHKVYDDIIENRRKLSENGSYIIENPEQNHLPNHVSYNFNQMAVFDVSWSQLAREFLMANNSRMRSTALRQFQQKKMGIFFDESKNNTTIDLDSLDGGYNMDDFKYEPWDVRIITADVQQDRMFVGIRDWSRQGASRLVAYKYCSTFADLEKIRVDYNVKPKAVFVDSAYRPQEVKLAGAQYGWIGLNGRGDTTYKVKNKQGKTIDRVYSDPVNYQIKTTQGLKKFQVINYSGVSVKDILGTLQSNPNHRWEIPSGGENYDMYIHQLNSEIRDINQATGKPYYRKIKDQNHSYDIEVESVVAAMIWNCVVFSEEEVEES